MHQVPSHDCSQQSAHAFSSCAHANNTQGALGTHSTEESLAGFCSIQQQQPTSHRTASQRLQSFKHALAEQDVHWPTGQRPAAA
jgi:hypothetical protein